MFMMQVPNPPQWWYTVTPTPHTSTGRLLCGSLWWGGGGGGGGGVWFKAEVEASCHNTQRVTPS